MQVPRRGCIVLEADRGYIRLHVLFVPSHRAEVSPLLGG